MAKLRVQAKYLSKVLYGRTAVSRSVKVSSLIVLGFVEHEHAEPQAFCAVAWSGALIDAAEPHFFLRCGWEMLLPKETLFYFSALLDDWKELLQTKPDLILASIRELSVGPIRTVEERMLERGELMEFLRNRIGEVNRFPQTIRFES